VPDCQRIVKKALAERLKTVYGGDWLPEDGAEYPVRFFIMKDRAVLYIDTSGTALHKRGYRPAGVAAPLRETLAAAIVDIARYRGRGDFCDPFCGSGTIAIEAALAAKNRAPGIARSFLAENWSRTDRGIWKREREAARAREYNGEYRIFASDIDPKAVATARANAARAGVEDLIGFSVADARNFSRATDDGTLCTNPPYGERLMEKESAGELYRAFGKALRAQPNWKSYIISSHEQFENCFGRRADKSRRLYNGMIPCRLFMYYK
jgi:putative N6-adenine-specific DNA methylase